MFIDLHDLGLNFSQNLLIIICFQIAQINKGKMKDELQDGRSFDDFLKLLKAHKIMKQSCNSKMY